MVYLWDYPWSHAPEGGAASWEELETLGVAGVNLASHYHSTRSLEPRSPEGIFVQKAGGCYFDPDPRRFAATSVTPTVNRLPPFTDPLAELTAAAADHELAVNAWTVLGHNTQLARSNRGFRMEDAYGTPQEHALCPSHPAVHEYYAAVLAAIAARGVREIQLESLGYPMVFHGHGATFGHDKHHCLMSVTEELLLSQCFCGACRDRIATAGAYADALQAHVQSLLDGFMRRPDPTVPTVSALLSDDAQMAELIGIRQGVIAELVEALATAADGTPLNYYLMDGGGLDVTTVAAAGVDLAALGDDLDRVTALCYLADPEAGRRRIAEITDASELPVDVGVTLDPQIIPDRPTFERLIEGVAPTGDGALHIYHYSLMTEAHLEWVAGVTDA